jgi:hypothetical protein
MQTQALSDPRYSTAVPCADFRRESDKLILRRIQLVSDVCEDLRAGRSPYKRLSNVLEILEKEADFAGRHCELKFVEGIFGVILGVSPMEAADRLDNLGAVAPFYHRHQA